MSEKIVCVWIEKIVWFRKRRLRRKGGNQTITRKEIQYNVFDHLGRCMGAPRIALLMKRGGWRASSINRVAGCRLSHGDKSRDIRSAAGRGARQMK